MKTALLASTILAFSMVTPAMAQQTISQTNDAQSAENAGGGVADIIVTAQRRSETSQRAAIAINVVTTADLKQAGVITATSLNAAVPALLVTRAGGANTSFYIRGVGNFTSNAYADPSIAFNLDGVYLGRPTSTTGTFFDLERIEVLKGPQGTLYGRNATGGAINVIPIKPQLGERSANIGFGYGNFNSVDAEGAINLPIGITAALRVAGKVVTNDGYNDDGTNDDVGQALRVQLLKAFSNDFKVRLAGDYSHLGGAGPGASYNGVYHFAPGAPAAAQAIPGYIYDPAPAGLGPYSGLLSPAARAYQSHFVIGGTFNNPDPISTPYVNNNYWGVNAEVNLDTGIGSFTFVPAYRKSKLDSNFNGPSFAAGLVNETDRQFSSELRLAGKSIGPVDWLIGGYYFDEKIKARYTFSQNIVNVYQDLNVATKSYATFGRLVLNATDKFRLVAGGRYTKDKKNFGVTGDTLFNICTTPGGPGGPGTCFGGPSVAPAVSLDALNASLAGTGLLMPLFPGAPGIVIPNGPPVKYGTKGNILFDTRLVINPQASFSRFTYKLGAEYDIAPASLLYVTYETGYHSGGFSVSQSHPTFEPEFITALTVGSKNRFFDNKVQVNIEGFLWKYKNQQVSHFGFEADGSTNFFTENLGRSTIKGIDVDLQIKAARNTLLRGSVQVLDNKIDSFVYYLPFGGTNLPPVTGCSYTAPVPVGATLNYKVDCGGTAGYNSPKLSLNGGIEQTFDMAGNKLVLRADARYRSNRVIGFEKLAQQNSGADTTVDVSATFGDHDDKWEVTGYIRNLTDKAAATIAQYSGSTGGSVSTIYTPPRTYGVRAAYKF